MLTFEISSDTMLEHANGRTEKMFYLFSQNNSGGRWDGPARVHIEADSAEEANLIAQDDHGIYFNGCEFNRDCACCGDRWYPVDEDDGTEVPEEYGKPVKIVDGEEYMGTPARIIVHKNGRTEK